MGNQTEGANHADIYENFREDKIVMQRQENIPCVQETARRSAGQEQKSQQESGWVSPAQK